MWYLHEATIEMKGPFPIDMLRYDRCHPATEEGTGMIEHSMKNVSMATYRVVVVGLSQSKSKWTEERWESFGAGVVSTSVT